MRRSRSGAAMAARNRSRVRVVLIPRFLQRVTWLLLAAYLLALVLHGRHYEPLVDGWLGTLVDILPAVACWSALPAAGARRAEAAAMALAISSFAAGDLIWAVAAGNDPAVSFPSAADIGYLGLYPMALAGIAIAVRRELRAAGSGVWLDSLLAGAGAAAVLALVLERAVRHALSDELSSGVALVYPILDVVLLAAVLGMLALRGWRVQPHWRWLLAGLLAFACADTLSALALADESYTAGGTVDVLWPAGLALLGLWARARPAAIARIERPVALLIPGIATAAGLVVLLAASQIRVSLIAVGLATLTQLAAAGRTQLAFGQLHRLADLRRQASTDELTGMANRRAFQARAEEQLAIPEARAALLLLDLDRFKEVNDSLGHHVGDRLLAEVARRLGENLREGDLIARIGGDEFAVLLQDAGAEHARAVALKLRAAVAVPCTLEGIMLRTDVSIGVALAPEHGRELGALLRRSDIAMYRAKKAREGHCVYSAADESAGAGRLRSIQELHTALVKDQMTLHFQPKLDLASGEVHSVEALVRWNHPTRGLLYPDSFLSLVEDAGLMRSLTGFVLQRAIEQSASWRRRGRPLTIAVNLSPSFLVDDDLPEQIAAMLAENALPASGLQLEITEEFLMADHDRSREILSRLRTGGIAIAVDDFGTGYSSLAYLRELPIDELKLDRSFVLPMAGDPRAAALVFSTIDLSHSLGLRMVAEGVEDTRTLEELARRGCDQAQGYVISRPLPAEQLGLWLDREHPLGLTADAGRLR